jgi:hypothetical protein
MALGNFVVQNGLTVGPLTIDAATGSISTSGTVNITGGLAVSTISKNDSSLSINDTGSGSNITFNIDGATEHVMTGTLTSLRGELSFSPDNTADAFKTSGNLTNVLSVATKSVNGFVQTAIRNGSNAASASSDFIAYADTGNDAGGYIDMGIANSLFSDAAFGITKPGDGYIFLSAPTYANANPTGGNLVLATASGSYSDIVFAAGGFVDGTEQGRFVLDDGLLVAGNLISAGGAIYQGAGAKALITDANATATLSTTANTTATTLTVGSTAGFLVHGALYAGAELMYYTSKTSTQFVGITRGTSGTTPESQPSGRVIYQPNSGLTNASTVLTGNADDFVQVAVKNINSGTSASTDVIAYASNGDNDSGWIDMGITSETFNTAAFGITGADDGYLFMSAPAGTTGDGALVIATSEYGVTNDIIFATDGFVAGNERVRIIGQDRAGVPAGVVVNIATTATSTVTGALRVNGGVGLQGNLYVGGNFNLQGNITIGGTGSTTSTSTLVIENPISFLANANNGDSQDIGIVGQYVGGTTKYAGVVRDSVTKSFRFFDGVTTKPTTTVGFATSSAGNVYAGQLMLANSTVSSSTTTGALIVAGGVGIGGKAYIGGEMTITGSIVPTANLTYNLGSPSSWWSTFYGVSTQAKYADLAENYQADKAYPAGTVVMFGGAAEVTQAEIDTRAVAGVVSTNPAHLMNGGLTGTNVVPVALQGRVPCNVIGPVRKGDLMVSAGFGYAKSSDNPLIGQVIGKALCDFPSATKAVIEIVVGRN